MAKELTPYAQTMPDDAWGLLLDGIRGKFPTEPAERHRAVHVLHETAGYVLHRTYPDPMPMGAAPRTAEVTSETPEAYVQRCCEAHLSGGMKGGMEKIDWQKWLPLILQLLSVFTKDKP